MKIDSNYSMPQALGIFATTICMAFFFSLILALPIWWLWNNTIPELFGLKEIDWWMAWKISMLTSFLFKSNVSLKKS